MGQSYFLYIGGTWIQVWCEYSLATKMPPEPRNFRVHTSDFTDQGTLEWISSQRHRGWYWKLRGSPVAGSWVGDWVRKGSLVVRGPITQFKAQDKFISSDSYREVTMDPIPVIIKLFDFHWTQKPLLVEEREKVGPGIKYLLDLGWTGKIPSKTERELTKLSLTHLALRELIIRMIK